MRARSVSSFVAFVVLSLALSPQTSRAEECSASIAAFSAAGHGLSGKETIYLATLNVDPDVTNAEFTIHSSSSPELALNIPVSHNKSSASGGWSWIALPRLNNNASISLVSVTKFGQTEPCAPPSVQPTIISASVGPETIYDDSHPHADFADSVQGQEVARDTSFGRKVAPEYPYMAIEEGITGTVAIEVEVGPEGGSPIRAWVRWASATGGSNLLTNPSLDATRESTFKAPVVDGRPDTERYLVFHTFALDDTPARSPVDGFNGCPLEIHDTRAVPPTGADPNAWYFFNVSATSGNIASATIAIRDQEGRIARYPWQPLTLAGPTNDERYSTASAAFNWPKTDVAELWVDQVVTSTGVTIHCDPNVDEPGTIASAVGSTRFISGKALDILGLEPTPRSQFTREVLPAYPKGADGTRAAGHVTVDTLVDATGHVVDAFVSASSGLDYLDTAAINAALASTYQPAAAGAVRAYELTYRFVP